MKPAFIAVLLAGNAAALLPAAAQYMEPPQGRLFTTPEERMNLERTRGSMPSAAPSVPAPPQPAPAAQETPAPPAPPARLAGVVRRSDGRATILVGDEARETTLGKLRPGYAVPVDTPTGRVLLKPGQSYDPNDGTIRDPR